MGNQVSKRKKKVVKKSDSTQPQEPRSSQASIMTTMESTQAAAVTLLECTMLGLSRQYVEQVQELHYLFKHVFQRNCMAPVDTLLTARGAQCLDIGCGPTATWIIDMAKEYPTTEFTGLDILDVEALNTCTDNDSDNDNITSLLPRHIPSNCHFKQGNVLETIDVGLVGSFDHIYQRFMFNVYPMDETMKPKFKELADLLKPGGYMEFIEPDMMPKQAGPKYTLLAKALYDRIKPMNNQAVFHGPTIKQCLVEADLEDIQSDYTSLPICWGGYVGKILYETTVSILIKLGPVLWPALDIDGEYDEQAYTDFVDQAFDECVEYKTYVNFHWAYGKRPVVDTVNKEGLTF